MNVINPSFMYEKRLWNKGYKVVAGADEVGRGSFAGPVVTAVVSFSSDISKVFENEIDVVVRDSKMMTERQRGLANEWIRNNAMFIGVGESSVDEINEKGISAATFSAYIRAIEGTNNGTNISIQYILIDGINTPYNRQEFSQSVSKYISKTIDNGTYKQMEIKKGDQKSFSISAASIVAKVYRDKLMENLGKKKDYLKYEWQKNKGYGTKAHRNAIVDFGTSRYHRTQYVNTFLKRVQTSK